MERYVPYSRKRLHASTDDAWQILLGGAHRILAAIFNFTMLMEDVVPTAEANYVSLVRMVNFSEPLSAEWHAVAQKQLLVYVWRHENLI